MRSLLGERSVGGRGAWLSPLRVGCSAASPPQRRNTENRYKFTRRALEASDGACALVVSYVVQTL